MEEVTIGELPELELPGSDVSINDTATALGMLLSVGQCYLWGGVVSRLRQMPDGMVFEPITSAMLPSIIEDVAQPVRRKQSAKSDNLEPTHCSATVASLILAADAFRQWLRPVRVLSRCPVLVERRNRRLITVTGYDRESETLAQGAEPETIPPEPARQLLSALLTDFRFATPSDRSRALSGLVTPALVMGGLFGGRAPIDLGEADASQTGKGYRNKITAAIYNDTPQAITVRKRGTGGLENSFDSALVKGKLFVSLDNVRGRIDSPAIESFCTEDSYCARPAFYPETWIDPRRVVLQFTSNRADITTDLANRCSCVRLLKQPQSHQFSRYPEGDLLSHVRANQPLYLGAVFAIVREWYRQGKPRTNETRHSFGEWAQSLDWIVQNLLGSAPLLDGHSEAQERMTNPATNWLRDVALAVVAQGRSNELLQASDLLNIIEESGTIEVPGVAGGDLGADETRKASLQQIGRRLGAAFRNCDELQIDHLKVVRQPDKDDKGRDVRRYMVLASGQTGSEVLPV